MRRYEKSKGFLYWGLEELEKIEGLEGYTELKVLNMTYNEIKKIEGLDTLVNLTRLCLERNNIEKIEGIETLLKLEYLGLARNKIQRIENIKTLPNSYIDLRGNPLKEITRESLEYITSNNIEVKMNGKLEDLKVVD